VDPPPAIKEEVARRKNKTARELVTANLNHVQLAACRKDQTAADATIGGHPCGAFTYYLCKSLREGGAGIERRPLIAGLEKALKEGHFDQSPQLETSTPEGPLFGPVRGGTIPPPGPDKPPEPAKPTTPAPVVPSFSGTPATLEQWAHVLDRIGRLSAEAQKTALEMIRGTLGVPSAIGRGPRAVAGHHLVYVHGICKHIAGFSDGWWDSLHPFTDIFGDGARGDTRHEVLWSELVEERALAARGLRAADDEQQRAANEIRAALEDRVDRHQIEAGPRSDPGAAPRALSDARGFINIPGLECVEDFTVYLVNDDVRTQIIGQFTGVVQPLLQAGTVVDIISHSWGTVVAYEGLRLLEDQGQTAPGVHNWFTVGAALSIAPVKSRLRPANRDGRRPALVSHWANLNAHGDVVGGPLKGRPYQVDDDFPNLDAVGCRDFLGLVSPVCAHGSYFVKDNVAVNRDIFAAFINQS
jgi:hypothetical protein